MSPESDGQVPPRLSDAFTAQLAVAFDTFWAEELPHNWYLQDLDAAAKQRFLGRETQFAADIIDATTALAERHNGPIVVLFDIDETIAAHSYNADPPRHAIRPAFSPVISELRERLGDRVSIGLLTSRGQSHLDEEINSPTLLGPVISEVNRDFVISVRSDSVMEHLVFDPPARPPEAFEETFNRPALESRNIYDLRKAMMLHVCTELHPDTGFVVVDDRDWVTELNPNNLRLEGVHLDGNSMFVV